MGDVAGFHEETHLQSVCLADARRVWGSFGLGAGSALDMFVVVALLYG